MSLAGALAACVGGQGSGNDPGAGGHGKHADCYGCHIDDYQGAGRHVNVKPERCEVCHHEDHWHPTGLMHEWALTGKHEKASCFSCHSSKPPVYEGTSRECIACHRADFDAQNVKSPSHATSSLVCDKCHSTNDWAEWPGHPKSDRDPHFASPPPATTPPPAPTPKPTATTPPPKPTATVKKPIPKPTATVTTPPAPTPTPTVTTPPVPTNTGPVVVTGASKRH